MTFWAYMLHCRGGAFYVGQTDDLERRIARHRTGAVAGFTADRLPVELVWSQQFPSREEAEAARARIKGWSRAKKLALIRGDEVGIPAPAEGKGGRSTSSARAEGEKARPDPASFEAVEAPSLTLHPHPAAPPLRASAVTATLRTDHRDWLRIRWRIAHADAIDVPPLAGRRRADGLWRATCFELFVAHEGERYAEFNFSPSERWAAYDFAATRTGMEDRPLARAPVCTWRGGGAFALFDAALAWSALPPRPWRVGISAVIVEGEATSYWALAHAGERPDFHDPACFAATLAAPAGT